MDSLDTIKDKNDEAQLRHDTPIKQAFDQVYGSSFDYAVRHGEDGHLHYFQEFDKFSRAVALVDEFRRQERRAR